MIDWLSLVVPCEHSRFISAGQVLSIKPDGETEWISHKRASVRGSHDATITIRSCSHTAYERTHVEISGNPVKWFQGHNLWGTDDLPGLVLELLAALVSHPELGLSPTVEDVAHWAAGEIQITRVDVTSSYHLTNRADVLAWLRAAEQTAHLSHRGRGQLVKGSTLYFGKQSRRWSLKLYSKGQELDARAQEPVMNLPSARQWADRTLRCELTLRSMELKRLGLDMVTAWLPLDGVPFEPTDLLRARMKGMTMTTNAALPAAEMETLRPALRMALTAWENGTDLRTALARPTFYRYRKELLGHGIDIAVPQPKEVSNVRPLVRVLEAVPVGVPDWAEETPLYFQPRRRAA